MSDPLISIVIPAYNYARFLGACIDGILAQTYSKWELIVVDNGSTDPTPDVLGRYDDPRIRKLKIDVNRGPVPAWALGYREIRGDYFALLPADDLFTPQKLERQVEYLRRHPEVHCVATYIDTMDDDGRVCRDDHWMTRTINRPIEYTDFKYWRWKHYFCIPTAIYQTAMCQRAGGIPLDGLDNICDWDFHVRLLGAGAKFAVIPEKLTLYRWHGANTSKLRHNTHNQWIYSHTRSFLPALRRVAPDYFHEIGQCIEEIYLDPKSSYFLEEAPPQWRCAHLEALLNPAGGLAEFPEYRDFQAFSQSWRVDTENRAAIAAFDKILMTMREKLLRDGRKSRALPVDSNAFPLERQLKEISSALGRPLMWLVHTYCKVKKELQRARRKFRLWLGATSLREAGR